MPAAGAPLVNCDDVTLVGHSFGGCTVLSILSSPPPSTADLPLPIRKVLLYDPWLEPLPSPGPTPIQTDKPSEQMLVINSEVFTLWKDHFARLGSMVDAWEPQGRSILTLVGSKHASFSDFYVLPMFRTKAAEVLLDTIATLSFAFLDGTLDATLQRVPTREMEVKVVGKRKDGRPKRRIVGKVGDVIAH